MLEADITWLKVKQWPYTCLGAEVVEDVTVSVKNPLGCFFSIQTDER